MRIHLSSILALSLWVSCSCSQQTRSRETTTADAQVETALPDPDSDTDGIADSVEIGQDRQSPQDSNRDGTADYLDPDCDDDLILDGHDGANDADRDGQPNRFDSDSDDDGISDRDEAGDEDLRTFPIDTDQDGAPDFLDPDSDDDGLSDRREVAAGTDRVRSDSDGDGVNDLIEVAAGTDPRSVGDSPRTRGDFVFVVPHELPPVPRRDTLDFATTLRSADVYFLMDTTSSMDASVDSLRNHIRTFIPEVRAVLSDVQFGIGEYRDYPVPIYGVGGIPPSDYAFKHRTSITGDPTQIENGLAPLRPIGGSDDPESLIPALYAVATGSGLPGMSAATSAATCPANTFGYPCFRANAVPIVVAITDQQSHNGPNNANPYDDARLEGHAPTYTEAIAALNARHINVIGIGQGNRGESNLRAICSDTGSVDATGEPLYSTWSGGEIGATVLQQIQALSGAARFDVSTRFVDDAADGVDTQAAFLDRLIPNESGDAARGCAARTAIDTNGDGRNDTFPAVRGQRVCFDVEVKTNTTVEPTATPQLYRATIQVIGDGFTLLDERDVYFLVPPRVEIGLQ